MGETNRRATNPTSRKFKTRVHQRPSLAPIAQNLAALQEDLEVARRIQGRLLPPRPAVAGYDFGLHYQPAGEIGGDFYDFIWFGADRLGVIVADASGKGLAGALLMVEARATIRAIASVCTTPRDILVAVNRVLLSDLDRGMFVTIFLAMLHVPTGQLTLASAGHTPVLLGQGKTARCLKVSPRGVVLGAATEGKFSDSILETTVTLDRGDRFVLYTDGVPELMNPVEQEYGMERLERLVAARSQASSPAFIRELVNDLEAHRAGQPQSDDITVVTARRMPTA